MDVITGGAQRRDARLVPILLLLGLLLAIVAAVAIVGSRPPNDRLAVIPSGDASQPIATASAAGSPSIAPSPLADASVSLPYPVLAVIPGDDAMWVSVAGEDTNELARSIYRLDPTTAEATLVVSSIDADPTSHLVFVESKGSLWVTAETNRMLRFDSSTGAPRGEIPLGNFPLESAVGFGAVWSPSYDDGTVTRIDPATGEVVATIVISQFKGEGVRDIAVGAELLWVITPRQDVLVGIDPATNTIAREVPLITGLHCEVSALAGRVWIEDCESADGLHVIDEVAGRELGRFGAELPGLGMPFHEDGGVAWFPSGDEVPPLSTKIIPVDVATLQNSELPSVEVGVMGSWFVKGFDSVWYSAGKQVHRLSLDSLPPG